MFYVASYIFRFMFLKPINIRYPLRKENLTPFRKSLTCLQWFLYEIPSSWNSIENIQDICIMNPSSSLATFTVRMISIMSEVMAVAFPLN